VSLNYTWLFISVLGLWGLALLWLPDNFPQWSPGLYWLVAVVVMLFFLASLISRELVRAFIARFDLRGITLYPFGAATPYRLEEIGTWRVLASMLAALAFNLLLGALLLLATGGLSGTNDQAGLVRAILLPLAWFNIWIGAINLIPGIPFDGGRVLTNTLFWFSGQREQGLGFTRLVGEITSLGMVLLGAWIGLTSQDWILALVLVVLGWGAREAEEKGKHLSILRTGLSEITAGDIMEDANPHDTISSEATVAQMVYSHPYFASDKPLPVIEHTSVSERGAAIDKLVGVVTLSKADDLLQGDWATTPVTSLMSSPADIESLAPGTPLARVLQLMEQRGDSPDEQPAVPVIDNGKLLGSIDPARLAAFEQAELELGAAEAPLPNVQERGIFALLKGIVPALAVVSVLAIMGNIAISSDPYSLRNLSRAEASAPITFTQTIPQPGTLVPDEIIPIRTIAISAQGITTASLTLDGAAVPVMLVGPDPTHQIITAEVPNPGNGLHTLAMVAADRAGRLGRTEWQFWVGTIGTPTPAPGAETLDIVQRQPVPGGLVLANSPQELKVGLLVSWGQPVTGVQLFIDGNPMPASLEQVDDTGRSFYASAPASNLAAGIHTVRAYVTGSAGDLYATDWTFSAIAPNDEYQYFEQTGFFVSRDFYAFWEEHGGLDIFGYPDSDRLTETDPDTGDTYTAQYFERARFELHPALDNSILLGRLGIEAYPPDPPTTGIPGAYFFPETGHNISSPFLEFWQIRGGLAIFGYPISEELTEASPLDGKSYRVQYFERARFELHPEFAGTPYEVQLGSLGVLVYNAR
jgi:Zn-dependent protease